MFGFMQIKIRSLKLNKGLRRIATPINVEAPGIPILTDTLIASAFYSNRLRHSDKGESIVIGSSKRSYRIVFSLAGLPTTGSSLASTWKGVEVGRLFSVFKIDAATGVRLGLLATGIVGAGEWVDLGGRSWSAAAALGPTAKFI